VIEALRTSILVPRDHLHIKQKRAVGRHYEPTGKTWPGHRPQERQITTVGLVPVALLRLWYHPVTQVQPPGSRDA
jgi:hypothetical protein